MSLDYDWKEQTMQNVREPTRRHLRQREPWVSILRLPARLFTWILSTVIGGKDNRPPDLPRDDYYDSSLLELQPTEAETKGATRIGEDGGVDYCGRIDEVKFAGPTLQLQEEGRRHKTNDVPFPLTRAERIFLASVDTDDNKEIIRACHRLNAEIMNCTQSIVDDWSRSRQDLSENRPVGQVELNSTDLGSSEVRLVIGDALRNRIARARSAPTSNEIFDLIPKGPIIEGEPSVQFIAGNLAKIVAKWNELTAMAMDSNAVSKQSTPAALHNLFERLVDLFNPQGNL